MNIRQLKKSASSFLLAAMLSCQSISDSNNKNDNYNRNLNINHNFNENENYNINLNDDIAGNDNANYNINENYNSNGNINDNVNGNSNENFNENENINYNANVNTNDNINGNGNGNENVNDNEDLPIESRYFIEKIQTGEGLEYRLMYEKDIGQHHFLSVIEVGGAVAIRPHPGVDANGWGSTWYPQPFFPGAVLNHTILKDEDFFVEQDDVVMNLEGLVSKGQNESAGNWQLELTVRYDSVLKRIDGEGVYGISILELLTEDLNLCKIASNFLTDVPLLDGTIGNTGDMKQIVNVSPLFQWDIFEYPSFFPIDRTNNLNVEVEGEYNIVDTIEYGYRIEPAYKPTLGVGLGISSMESILTFGGIYDLDHSKEFFSDNVGITPLIRVNSTESTEFIFHTTFYSNAILGD